MNNSCDHSGSFISGMLAGLLVGGAVALLYAPKSGKETRKYLQKKALDLKDQAIDTYEDVREGAMEMKERAGRAVKAAEKEIKKS